MKVIKDNYNKKLTCPHCKSKLLYNEKEIESENYHFTSAFGNWSEIRFFVKCPLCGHHIFLEKKGEHK